VLDGDEQPLMAGRFGTDRDGYRRLLAAGRQFPQRLWAVEGCQGVSRHLAQRLVADGEHVVDVPAKLSARARVFSTGQGPKTDATDAHSVAVVALRTRSLRQVRPDDRTVALRLLADRRDELGAARTLTINRLHRLLVELEPGGAKKALTARQARALLAGVPAGDVVHETRLFCALCAAGGGARGAWTPLSGAEAEEPGGRDGGLRTSTSELPLCLGQRGSRGGPTAQVPVQAQHQRSARLVRHRHHSRDQAPGAQCEQGGSEPQQLVARMHGWQSGLAGGQDQVSGWPVDPFQVVDRQRSVRQLDSREQWVVRPEVAVGSDVRQLRTVQRIGDGLHRGAAASEATRAAVAAGQREDFGGGVRQAWTGDEHSPSGLCPVWM
jgi:hypothetical protein